jgi:hypothetical protein
MTVFSDRLLPILPDDIRVTNFRTHNLLLIFIYVVKCYFIYHVTQGKRNIFIDLMYLQNFCID